MSVSHEIVIPEQIFTALQAHLLSGAREEVALLFAHTAATPTATRLLVRRWEPVPEDALIVHESDQFTVDSAFLVRHTKRARAHEESILLAHSHPQDLAAPEFSWADLRGERDLYPFLHHRLPNRPHGAIVISPAGVAARLSVGRKDLCSAAVRAVGRHIALHSVQHGEASIQSDPLRARQELLWGSRGQSRLRHATMAVIGAGGTGSLTCQQLIHLGAGSLIVVDEQVASESNLARIVGMSRDDIDRTPKVEIVARAARAVDPSITVRPMHASVCRADVLRELRDADVIFLCTDGHWSRAVINAFAVQYLIPLVDMAFAITMNDAGTRVASAVGDTRLVVPGGYCLSCAGALDADRIRSEQASPEERRALPEYFVNLDVEDPSVITVNSTVASLAVSLGVDLLVPTMRPSSPDDGYRYNALKGLVRHEARAPTPACGICGVEGIAGFGDDHPLPCA